MSTQATENKADVKVLTPLANKAPDGSSTPFALPTDGFYHLAPIGEFPHPSGVIQVLDAKSIDSMVNRFREEMPGGFPGLLLDYEHRSHENDGSTEAAGWIVGLENRADGLWADIRWSDSGRASVAGGRYRFPSPTWMAGDCEWVGENRLRPLRLADAALTNRPNLRGLVPLSNRQQPAAEQKPQTTEKTTTPMDHKAQLLSVVGLPSDASDSLITTASETVLANAKKGKDYDELKTKFDALQNSQADSDLDAAGITDPEERKDLKESLLENRTRTLRLLANAAKRKGTQAATTLTNRASAKTPGQGNGATTEPATPAADGKSQMRRQQQEIEGVKLANKGISNEAAYQLAKAKNPDLFKPAADQE